MGSPAAATAGKTGATAKQQQHVSVRCTNESCLRRCWRALMALVQWCLVLLASPGATAHMVFITQWFALGWQGEPEKPKTHCPKPQPMPTSQACCNKIADAEAALAASKRQCNTCAQGKGYPRRAAYRTAGSGCSSHRGPWRQHRGVAHRRSTAQHTKAGATCNRSAKALQGNITLQRLYAAQCFQP